MEPSIEIQGAIENVNFKHSSHLACLLYSQREPGLAQALPHLNAMSLSPQAPDFPEFEARVQEAINSLGGNVFPKLNWSAPRVCTLHPPVI